MGAKTTIFIFFFQEFNCIYVHVFKKNLKIVMWKLKELQECTINRNKHFHNRKLIFDYIYMF